MYLKRQKVPKNWPIERKGTAYVVRPNYDIKNGVPVLIILRDMLKIAQNRKEVKKAIHAKNILVNGKNVKDEKNNVLLFDTIAITPLKKYYRLNLSHKGKFETEEIKENEINYKIAKIVNKKIIKNKRIQFNLSDGRNFLSDVQCGVNDSVLINFKEKKIEKCLPLREKEKVIVFAGKHSGAKGVINNLNLKNKMAELTIGEREVNVLIKQLMVIK